MPPEPVVASDAIMEVDAAAPASQQRKHELESSAVDEEQKLKQARVELLASVKAK